MARTRTLINNLGPNEVCIYSVPGKRNRRVIDTTYEIDAVVEGKWTTVGRYTDQYRATAFAEGVKTGRRLAESELSDVDEAVARGDL